MPDELRSFRAIPNVDGTVIFEELTDQWRPVVTTPASSMATDAELTAAIATHAALPDAHHLANAGMTGSKVVGGYRLTFTNGLLTNFEQV